MEMKADIADKPEDTMFHKIYIQRYENVRYVASMPRTTPRSSSSERNYSVKARSLLDWNP